MGKAKSLRGIALGRQILAVLSEVQNALGTAEFPLPRKMKAFLREIVKTQTPKLRRNEPPPLPNVPLEVELPRGAHHVLLRAPLPLAGAVQEARNTPFCRSQEKFHTVAL